MATFEVHDGLGRVRRVNFTREQTILFGSSPKCEIVLDDPEVLHFHGRLRWKRDRFKVDASPEAEFIEVNGRKMASSSFRQGDEIQAGSCRIFLITDDDDSPEVSRRPRDDKTRVQPPPSYPNPEAGPKPKSDATVVQPPPLPRRGRKPNLEKDEWLDVLEVAAPSLEEPLVPGEVPGRRTEPGPRTAGSGRGWGGLVRALRANDLPPGQERILSSPLVVGLVVALVVLVLLSLSLWGIIQRTVASRLYNQAVESLNEGDYRNAIRRFDEFLSRDTGDARASKARVLRALVNVRQFTATTSASWTNALDAERAMVRTVSREPSYRDSSTELAELVLKTAEALADRARVQADPRALAEAESALELHANVAGKAAEAFVKRSRVPGKLADARAAVHKASIRARALAAMDAALRAGSSSGVYDARDALIGQYGDLAGDRALIERMTKANDLIRRAVTVDTSRRPAETEPQSDPFGPPTSLVLRSAPRDQARPASPESLVFALAEGFAAGLDGANGDPLWQVPVGQSSPFPPRPIPGGSTVLAFDARFDELVRLDARTGALIWRQALGEPVNAPPLVLGNQVLQSTSGGKLLLIDLASGELRATVNLGMPLAQPPISDEAGQFLYLLADQDCLFLLSRDPLECVAVEYLGHAAGSVACPPARLGRFLVVAENHTVDDSRWHVFVIDEDGTRVRPVQQVGVAGWTWGTPASSGTVIWATGDRGSTAAYAIGGYDEKSPFRLLGRTNPEPNASGPAFAMARSERELWIASGRSARLELDPETSKIQAAWTLGEAGPALAPPQSAGDLLVLTQQYNEGAGVALWGIEPHSGSVRWRTVLGAAWRVAPSPSPSSDALITLTEDGRRLALARERITSGGFVEVPLPKPGDIRIPPGPLRRVEAGGLTVLVPGSSADHLLVRSGAAAEDFRRVDLPSTVGATPMLWGNDLLVPGVDGRVDLLDPGTGATRAEPYIAPFDRARPIRWLAPVRLDGDAVALADETGRVRRLVRSKGSPPRLVAAGEVSLGGDLAADPIAMEGALVLVTRDGRIRSLASRDLSPVGAWPLEAPLATPPSAVAGRGFLSDSSGDVQAFGPDGLRLWSITLRDGPPFGPPVVAGDSVWFLGRGGSLERHALADGALLDRVALDILPAGHLQALGSQLVVPVGPGTLRTLKGEQ
jgi:outer membrane protein assembly factor BamB